jgi:hypothetical protein
VERKRTGAGYVSFSSFSPSASSDPPPPDERGTELGIPGAEHGGQRHLDPTVHAGRRESGDGGGDLSAELARPAIRRCRSTLLRSVTWDCVSSSSSSSFHVWQSSQGVRAPSICQHRSLRGFNSTMTRSCMVCICSSSLSFDLCPVLPIFCVNFCIPLPFIFSIQPRNRFSCR